MIYYRHIVNKDRPVELKVSSKVYVREWEACWIDKSRDMSKLLEMAKPFLEHWNNLLTLQDYEKDVNYISLCALLSLKVPGSELIRAWRNSLPNDTTVLDELTYLYILHVRTANYFPHGADPDRAEFVVANDFKYRLNIAIRTYLHKNRYPTTNIIPEIGVIYPQKDVLLIRNLDLTPWQKYLLELVLQGKNSYDIAHLCRIPRRTFGPEEDDLWHQLKKSYYEEME